MQHLKRLLLITILLHLVACGQKGALLYPAPEPEQTDLSNTKINELKKTTAESLQ